MVPSGFKKLSAVKNRTKMLREKKEDLEGETCRLQEARDAYLLVCRNIFTFIHISRNCDVK